MVRLPARSAARGASPYTGADFSRAVSPSVALHLAHAAENLLTLCSLCHAKVERARGARTALSGLSYLLRNLAPVFLMCDPATWAPLSGGDVNPGSPRLSSTTQRQRVGLSPRLLGLWERLAEAALERVLPVPAPMVVPHAWDLWGK